jgi:hypothetical protein
MEENKKCMEVVLSEEIKSALNYIENQITREANKGKNEIEIWYANICVAVREDSKIKYVKNEDLLFMLIISALKNNGYAVEEIRYTNRRYLHIKW